MRVLFVAQLVLFVVDACIDMNENMTRWDGHQSNCYYNILHLKKDMKTRPSHYLGKGISDTTSDADIQCFIHDHDPETCDMPCSSTLVGCPRFVAATTCVDVESTTTAYPNCAANVEWAKNLWKNGNYEVWDPLQKFAVGLMGNSSFTDFQCALYHYQLSGARWGFNYECPKPCSAALPPLCSKVTAVTAPAVPTSTTTTAATGSSSSFGSLDWWVWLLLALLLLACAAAAAYFLMGGKKAPQKKKKTRAIKAAPAAPVPVPDVSVPIMQPQQYVTTAAPVYLQATVQTQYQVAPATRNIQMAPMQATPVVQYAAPAAGSVSMAPTMAYAQPIASYGAQPMEFNAAMMRR